MISSLQIFKRIARLIFLGALFTPFLNAQVVVNPLEEFIHTTSDNPLRLFDPTDIGFDAGDINGDGRNDFVVQNFFYPDLSTPQSGDYLESSYIYNMNAEGEKDNFSINVGSILHPAGDLNNDGRDDLISYVDGELKVYSFAEGALDISTLPMPVKTIPFSEISFNSEFQRLVVMHDLNNDGIDDLLFKTEGFNPVEKLIHIIFGNNSSENISLVTSDITPNIGNSSMVVNVGNVRGDQVPEIVTLSRSQVDSEVIATTFSVQGDTATAIDTTGLNLFENIDTDLRFYIADIDGENKDDILLANNRYQGIGGFTRIFFSQPYSYVAFNTDSSSSTEKKKLILGEDFFGEAKTYLNNYSIDTISRLQSGEVQIALFAFGLYSLCEEENINTNASLGEDVCENPTMVESSETNQIRPTKYSPNNSQVDIDGDGKNDIRAGFLNLNDFIMGGGFIRVLEEVIEVKRELDSILDFINERKGSRELITPEDEAFILFYSNLPQRTLIEFIRVENNLRIQRQITAFLLGPESLFNLFGLNDFVAMQSATEVHIFDILDSTPLKNTKAEEDTVRADQIIDVKSFQEVKTDFGSIRVENVGDITSDGEDDMLISSGFLQDSSNQRINEAWIFSGGETLSEMPDYTFDFSEDTTIQNLFSFSIQEITAVGDVNEDGIDDFMMDNWLYFGAEEAPVGYKYPDIVLEPDSVNGQPLQLRTFAAGDFNGDGVNDIVAGISGFGELPFAKIYYGGSEMDGKSDKTLYATRNSLGRDGTDFVPSGFFGGTDFQFMPKESGKTHQDLLFLSGVFGFTNDAVIFHGGESDSLPDVRLEVNAEGGTGFSSDTPVAVDDFNGDGFYDIILTESAHGDDALTSSRSYIFSPNSGITISNEEEIVNTPNEYELLQNYPNPFNPTTNIQFSLPQASNVNLEVYDILGRKVAELLSDARYASGSHTISFDASNLASGMYIYRIAVGDFTQTQKMMLVK